MLLGWVAIALGRQGPEAIDQTWSGVPRIDNVIDVAAGCGAVGVGKFVGILLGQPGSLRLGILGRPDS